MMCAGIGTPIATAPGVLRSARFNLRAANRNASNKCLTRGNNGWLYKEGEEIGRGKFKGLSRSSYATPAVTVLILRLGVLSVSLDRPLTNQSCRQQVTKGPPHESSNSSRAPLSGSATPVNAVAGRTQCVGP